jgi:hypothetical protein
VSCHCGEGKALARRKLSHQSQAGLDRTSEDEDAAKREVLDGLSDERDDFMARFPTSAFVGVAQALKLPEDAENLARLARVLRTRLYTLYESCSGNRPSPSDVADRLRQLRDAATLITSADALLRMPLALVGEPEGEQFFATAEWLAKHWGAELDRRPSSRAGRPRHTLFRELIADLVPVYERMTGRRARRPGVRRSNPYRGTAAGYGGYFCRFAVAIWQCVFRHIPEAHRRIPGSEGAVAEALRNHWHEITDRRGKN